MSLGPLLVGGQTSHRSPYPGLRTFEKDEADLFFGREEQVDQLLAKLRSHRFLAVVGPSGCGKSSLVRAGLIPALEAGAMIGGGLNWRIAVMRPGHRPLYALTRTLLRCGVLGARDPNSDEQAALLGATLRRGPLGLVEALREPDALQEGANLLLLVDQFEEIFRYQREGDPGEARAFVDLLMASASERGAPVYVVITMRTDHLGNCPVFPGLPEMMNDSQFLTPRLTREQCRAAIVGPVEWFDAEVDPAVVTLILNEMGTDPDQLPLMQHLLMRMWRLAILGREGAAEPPPPVRLTRDHYDSAGGLAGALNDHADSILEKLGAPRRRQIAERMFRCLTEITPDNNKVRRPTGLKAIRAAADAEIQDVTSVIDEFRAEGRSFLMPLPKSPPEPLRPDTVIDISHESLIRQWKKLGEWTEDEHRARKVGRNILERARVWDENHRPEDGLLSGRQLKEAEEWAASHPHEVERVDLGAEFLAESQKRSDREERRARFLRFLLRALAASLVAFALAALYLGWRSRQEAKRAKDLATGLAKSEVEAQEAAAEAKRAATVAADQERIAKAAANSANRLLKEKLLNDSRVLAEKAATALERDQNPEAALLLAVEGARILSEAKPPLGLTSEVESALRRAIQATGGAAPDRVLDGDGSSTDALAFSRDGHRLIASSRNGTIRLWDLRQDYPLADSIPISRLRATAQRIEISPDGSWMVAAFGRIPVLYDLEDVERQPRAPIVLAGFGGPIVAVAFAREPRRWLAIGDNSGTTRVWELDATRRTPPRQVLDFSDKGVSGSGRSTGDLAFSDDGRYLASGDSDGVTRVWDLDSPAHELGRLQEQRGSILDLEFARDGRLATVGAGDTVCLWRLDAPSRPERIFKQPPSAPVIGPANFSAVAFAPGGRWMATANAAGSVLCWDLQAPEPAKKPIARLEGAAGHITGLRFGAGPHRGRGPWLAAITSGLGVQGASTLWDLSRLGSAPIGPPAIDIKHGPDQALAFGPGGRWLAVAGPAGAIQLYDLHAFDPDKHSKILGPNGAPRALDHTSLIHDLALAPDGHTLATACEDGRIRLWDPDASSGPRKVLEGHAGWPVTNVAISPDGRWLAAWSSSHPRVPGTKGGCAVLLCDLRKPSGKGSADEPFRRVVGGIDRFERPSRQRALAFDHRSRWLATGGGEVLLWDLGTVDPAESARTVPGRGVPVTALSFSPDGQWLAEGDLDGHVSISDGRAGWGRSPEARAAGNRLLIQHNGPVTGVAFTPHDRLVSASWDGTVRMIGDLAHGEPDKAETLVDTRGPAIDCLALASSGHTWLAVGDRLGRVHLRDLSDFEAIIPSPEAVRGTIHALTFSTDGSWLAMGSSDGEVRVCAIGEQAGIRVLTSFKHPWWVTTLVFSPGDGQLISACADNKARIWPIHRRNDLIALAGALARRNMTVGEWSLLMNRDVLDYHKTVASLPIYPGLVTSALKLAKEGHPEVAQKRLRRLIDLESHLRDVIRDPAVAVERARARGLVEKARVDARADDPTRAEKHLNDAIGELKVAALLDHDLGLDPRACARRQQALGWVDQALAHELQGTGYNEARGLYRRARNTDPEIGLYWDSLDSRLRPLIRREQSKRQHDHGKRLAEDGHDADAINALEAAHEADKEEYKDHPNPRLEVKAYQAHARAQKLAARGDSEKAIAALKEAHELAQVLFKEHLDPKQEIWSLSPSSSWSPSSLLANAHYYSSSNREQARTLLKDLAKAEPEFDLDADTYIDRVAARAEVFKGRNLAQNLGRSHVPSAYPDIPIPDLLGRPDEIVRRAAESLAALQRVAPDLNVDPERLAKLYVGRALLDEGRRLALEGREPKARDVFGWAQQLLYESGYDDPHLVPKFDVGVMASSHLGLLGSDGFLSTAIVARCKTGRLREAFELYQEARKIDPLVALNPGAWNGLCWFSSLSGDRDEIERLRFAGDVAVTLMPEDGNIRDTRGLARALAGDRKGAIADFEAFRWWTGDYNKYKQRTRWIKELRSGTPISTIFQSDVMRTLRGQ